MKINFKKALSMVLSVSIVFAAVACAAMTAGAETYSGTCGETLTWNFDDVAGTLTISGYGDMYDYSDSRTPWDSYTYTGIRKIEFDGEIASIGDDSFFDCKGLTSITIPESVTRIGDKAFWLCSNLESITIPDSVTSIGSDAFLFTKYYNDESNWENGALYIGNHLIQINEDLSENYCVREGTRCIASGAFFYYPGPNPGDELRFCDWLKSVTIPNSVAGIGLMAFYQCSSLTDVYYYGSEEQWNAIRIDEGNETLLNANIHFNPTGPASEKPRSQDRLNPKTGETIPNAIMVGPEAGDNIELEVVTMGGNIKMPGTETFTLFDSMDISLEQNGKSVELDKPVSIYFSKDYLGRDKSNLFIVHQKKDGSYKTFINSNISEGGPGYENYWKITVTSLSPFAIYKTNSETGETPAIKIKANPGTKNIDWGQVLRLEAEAPKGYEIRWFTGKTDTGKTGTSFDYDSKKGNSDVKAVLYKDGKAVKADGKEICDSEKVTVNSGFLKKLIAFFKYTLFRMDNTVKN